LVLAGVGVTTQVAQWFLTRGLSLVPAGRAITVGYSQILFAALWGILFFAEYPDLWTIAGACLVVLGTAFVSFPEKKAVSIPIR
jgi:drug/metabolite transporter (DMT)-like permease